MNSLSTILSNGANSNSATGGSSVMFIVVYIIIFGAIIYFMMIRPQKKQRVKTQEMQNRIEPGDNIMTTSGFYGTVLDVVDDTTIIVEFGNNKNCRIPMHKNAVAELEKQGSAVVTEDDKDKDKDKSKDKGKNKI